MNWSQDQCWRIWSRNSIIWQFISVSISFSNLFTKNLGLFWQIKRWHFKVKFTFANNCRTLLLTKNGCLKEKRLLAIIGFQKGRFVSLFLCLLWSQLNKIAELAIKFWLNWRTLTMSVTSMAYKWSNFRILHWPRDTVSKHSLLWSTSGMETLWHSMVSLAIYDHNNCWLKK